MLQLRLTFVWVGSTVAANDDDDDDDDTTNNLVADDIFEIDAADRTAGTKTLAQINLEKQKAAQASQAQASDDDDDDKSEPSPPPTKAKGERDLMTVIGIPATLSIHTHSCGNQTRCCTCAIAKAASCSTQGCSSARE